MNFRVVLFVMGALSLRAQPYTFLNYSVGEGLAQSQVYAIWQDSRGYLWCGTQGGGLSRFDGRAFQTFNTQQGLPSDYVNTLYEDRQKRMWVGVSNGYGVCRQSQFFAGFKSGDAINAICQTPEGEIWLGTKNGIYTCQNPTDPVLPLPSTNGLPNSFSAEVFLPAKDGIWVGTNKGAFRMHGKEIIALTSQAGLPSNPVSALAYDTAGRLWIALVGAGLVVFDETTRQFVATYPQRQWVTCLQTDAEGKMWAGTTNDGVFVFNPSDRTWIQITEREGLPHNHVRDLLLDKNGQMWVASSGGGIARVLRQQFRHYTTANGLLGNRIYALHADDAGRLWFSAAQNGLQMLDTAGFHTVTGADSPLNGVKCKAILSDRRGRIWAGTEGRGLFMIDSAGAHPIEGLPSPRIQSLVLASTGEIWVAMADKGLARLQEQTAEPDRFVLKKYGTEEGLNDLNISTLKADGKGNIWFATQSGAFGFVQDGKRVASYGGVQNKLPAMPIRALAFDQTDHLWLGYRGGGVWGVKMSDLERDPNASFSSLGANLASQNVYLLLSDRRGHFWVGSEKGVDEVIFDTGKANTPGMALPVKETRHYGHNEGFFGIETCQDATLCDKEGNLWFGTMNGLTKYVPGVFHENQSPPELHFQDITLFYKPLSETAYADRLDADGGLRDGLAFEWNENHLSFGFEAVDLANPEGLRYRWKLEGAANADWSPFSTQKSVNFAGLQAGSYTFFVQAVAADGRMSQLIKAAFSIKKPFWQTSWFWLIAGTGICLLVFAAFRARIRQVRLSESEKRARLEVENRILQLEQKALQLQMNPHFIFNALNSVQSLVSAGETEAARTELHAFARLMRSILSNSRRSAVSLREEADMLAQYLQIEQFCRPGKPFDYDIRFAEGLDPEAIELPPMLLQPFVENAVLHGLAHLQNRRGKIDIQFETEAETLRCIIADNGVGREKAALLRGERPPEHSSAALQITRERLAALAGDTIDNPLEINDIYDDSGGISGTKVVAKLPLHQRW